MTTYEDLVDALLPHGVMPLVVPQLKTITIGGAVTGLGIERTPQNLARSQAFRFGGEILACCEIVPTHQNVGVAAPAGGAGNYVVFRNLTSASFTLTATPGTGSPTRAPVNGLQIVAPTGS